MKTPWPFTITRTVLIIIFDLVIIALLGFVLFSGYVI
jgi:hypothetical protein